MFRPLATAVLLLSATVPVSAQRGKQEQEPKRPRLTAGLDTNSASAYFFHGVSLIERQPELAADAFYWASRLDPSWADPLYARRISLHMRNPRNLARYVFGDPGILRAAETRRIDSLHYQALIRNPFVFTRLDKVMLQQVWDELRASNSATNSTRENGGSLFLAADFGNYARLAWMAYSNEDFPKALDLYAEAIRRDRRAYGYHGDRARIFFHMAQYDSAIAEMSTLLETVRTRDKDKFTFVYESRALYEYSMGRIHEAKGDLKAAKEAYGRVLTEDVSFYMAHAALGGISLAAGDTTMAMSEYHLAVKLRGDDASLRHVYGYVLAGAGKFDEAIVQFRRAIEINPDFAPPYYYLGRMLEQKGDNAALEQYKEFVARSRADDARIAVAKKVLEEFAGLVPATNPPD